VGVVLYCRDQKFLQVKYKLDDQRLLAICGGLDCDEVKEHLFSFEQICKGESTGGPIASLDLASRFRWLTATRSTVVQTSKVHPGLCEDAEEMLEKLFGDMVL
jgi:hypothetical protein